MLFPFWPVTVASQNDDGFLSGQIRVGARLSVPHAVELSRLVVGVEPLGVYGRIAVGTGLVLQLNRQRVRIPGL